MIYQNYDTYCSGGMEAQWKESAKIWHNKLHKLFFLSHAV